MPRKSTGPRLYLRKRKGRPSVWVILDGTRERSTEFLESEFEPAQEALADYFGEKWRPPQSQNHPDQLGITEVLAAYALEHAPSTKRPDQIACFITQLMPFWGGKMLSVVRGGTCRAYTEERVASGVTAQTARRELETLRAAINYFHREYGLDGTSPPPVPMPDKSVPRDRWLRRDETAAVLLAAWRGQKTQHVARFILIGIYSGTRPGAILKLHWIPSVTGGHVDLDDGVTYRRASGSIDDPRKRQTPVRIHDRLIPHLRRWRQADIDHGITRVIHHQGRGITKLRRSWNTVRTEAGLGMDVVPHVLRHTAATWLMQAGVDIFEAAGYLGMMPETLNRVYGHHHPDFQKNAASATTKPRTAQVSPKKRVNTE